LPYSILFKKFSFIGIPFRKNQKDFVFFILYRRAWFLPKES